MRTPRLRFWLLAEFAIVLVLPGRVNSFFGGAPLTQPLEYFLVCVLLINLFMYALAAYHVPMSENTLRSQLDQDGFAKVLSFANKRHFQIFGFIFFLKLVLFSTNYTIPLKLFNVCYVPVSETAGPAPCYMNADNVFRFRDCTYLDERFKWDGHGDYENWYLNDHRFPHDQEFHVRLSGYLQAPSDRTLKILYAGPIRITIGNDSLKASSPQLTEKRLTLPEGTSLVPVLADVQVTPQSYVEIQRASQMNDWQTMTAAAPDASPIRMRLMDVAVYAVGAYVLGLGALFLSQILLYVSLDWNLLLPILFVTILFKARSMIGVPAFVTACYALTLVEKMKRGRVDYLNWVLIITVTFGVFSYLALPAGHHLLIRGWQDDPLTYDTLGRSILRDRSLMGGEALYHNQPGFRYYMALILAIFGEYNYFPQMMIVCFYLFCVWLMFAWLDNRIEPTPLSRFSSLVSVVLLTKVGTPIVAFNISEGLTWILSMISLMALFSTARWNHLTDFHFDTRRLPFWAAPLFSALVALTAVIRPNQVVGSVALYLVGIGVYTYFNRQDKRISQKLLLNLAIYGTILLFPLWHNLYYAHQFVLFSQGSTDTVWTLKFPPSRFLELGSSAQARKDLWYQISHLLVLRKWLCMRMNILTTTVFNMVLGIFILSAIRAYRLGAHRLVAIACFVVFGYAVVHVFYLADNYYPRHIMEIYLMMTIFSVPMLCKVPQNPGE